MNVTKFRHPEPEAQKGRVFPVFIPFAGCPTRCVFCSQEAQSGRLAAPLPAVLERVRRDFEQRSDANPLELAFYGGTFTALPQSAQEECLNLAAELKARGLVTRVRCSTRPDAVSPGQLNFLRDKGLDLLELGVQSFCDGPLAESRRGYAGERAREACRLTLESGLSLGVQLMPGMPGMRAEHFMRDVELCAAIAPETVRLYPCMVLKGTELADIWQNGLFTPWPLELVLELLPEAMLKLWAVGSRIIRMGLAPEPSLAPDTLAGPAHPALGQILRSKALFLYVTGSVIPERLKGAPYSITVPSRFQGEFFGHKNELRKSWIESGLVNGRAVWHDAEHFEIHYR